MFRSALIRRLILTLALTGPAGCAGTRVEATGVVTGGAPVDSYNIFYTELSPYGECSGWMASATCGNPALWVPGHRWGPAWVDWRVGGGYVGWTPTPPAHVTVAQPRYVFVERGRMGAPRIDRVVVPAARARVALSVTAPIHTLRPGGNPMPSRVHARSLSPPRRRR